MPEELSTFDEHDPDTAEFVSPSLPEKEKEFELTPEDRVELVQAINIGKARKDVIVLGHVVSLKTLSVREELQLAMAIKKYEPTQGYQRAFMTGCVAASVERIDHKPVYTPINEADKEELISRKFDVLSSYHAVFLEQIFVEFRKLEQETNEILLEKLGKSKG